MTSKIEEIIAKDVLSAPDQYVDEVYRTHWRTSNFGRCYRMQYWYRKGEAVSNPIELKALHIFRVGNIFHRDIQALLPQDEVEIEFKTEDVFGHADYVPKDGDYVEDFKTIGSFPWKLMGNKNYDIVKDKMSYIYQVMAYCKFLSKPRGILTFVHKDSYSIRTFEFKYSFWEETIETELEVLRRYWKEDILPPAVPRAYGCRDCSYCPFQYKCDELEGNTAKDRFEASRPKKKKIF